MEDKEEPDGEELGRLGYLVPPCSVSRFRARWVQEIRKVVQSLEQTAREILTLLQGVHQGTGFQDTGTELCSSDMNLKLHSKEVLESLRTFWYSENTSNVSEDQVPCGTVLQVSRALAVCAPASCLPGGICSVFGNRDPVEPDREKGFHLDVEDYLSGVIILASELSRLSVNSVTAGDYSRPLHISTFINELDSGFHLLNLKNDSLRKRYDGLKYDVKKVEEVVYDLSIRGFNKETAAACGEK
ncbi:hypothetical protein STEG23_016927 [Scotinomys teguina]